MTNQITQHPVDAQELFGVDVPFAIHALGERTPLVPAIDPDYCFDASVTRAILAGFATNIRVLIHGLHGTGKSSHIMQVAARLNYPCVRLNLDGHISRTDLLGRDTIAIENGQQKVLFKESLLPASIQRACVLILDEYDAAPPEVAFVLQRLLEDDGVLTIAEENRNIVPHPFFRLFATANTIGNGDMSGIYHGTSLLNQAQLDRWGIIARLDYLSAETEVVLIKQKFPALETHIVQAMVQLANMTRYAFKNGDLSLMMSPRTVLHWAKNIVLLHHNIAEAFAWAFVNRIDAEEVPTVNEFYQRCFAQNVSL